MGSALGPALGNVFMVELERLVIATLMVVKHTRQIGTFEII